VAYAFPGGVNTFVPSHEASDSLVVGFSRNPKKFKLPEYAKYIPVKQGAGYYLQLNAQEGARIINSDLADLVWPDGTEAPLGNNDTESFQFVKFLTKRYITPFNIGFKATEQADWEVIAVNAGVAAQKMMTARTMFAWNILGTAANYGSNTSTATALGNGLLDQATQSSPYIKKCIRAACEAILQSTIGVVNRDDLIMVMNPHTAGLLSESPEIMQYFVNNVYALAQARGDAAGQNTAWGLPDRLYGIKVVVEDAVRITSKKLAPVVTVGYCCPNETIAFLARPGKLMGMEGIPEFSSFQFFFYEEFTVEQKEDPDNRRTVARVVEDYDAQIVAPLASYLITSATSS
jgi:hypothetical protein